jgi:hypothetical protein
MVAAVTRPSFHQRKRMVRNLRNGPAFLTETRVAGLLDWLDAVRPGAAIVGHGPASPAPVATIVPEPVELPRLAAAALIARAPKISIAPATFRLPRRKASVATPAVAGEGTELATAASNAERVQAAIREVRDRGRRAADDDQQVAAARAAQIRVQAELQDRRDEAAATGKRARPPVRVLGEQNGAPAIAWLRSHGVSVKAASTSMFGTRYLVSNEFGELDVAAVVAIARRKGFAG